MAADGSRNEQLERAVRLIMDLVRVGGLTVDELADLHGKTARTIRRDLDALRAVGLELAHDLDGKKRRWRIDATGKVATLSRLLDVSHFLALRAALVEVSAAQKHPVTFAALEDLSQKIEKAIGARGRAQLVAIEQAFHPYEKFAYATAAPDHLAKLVRAIGERRVCRVTYRSIASTVAKGGGRARGGGGRTGSAGGSGNGGRGGAGSGDKTYEALPLRIFAHGGATYAWVFVPRRRKVVCLNLHRLAHLDVLDRRAEPPADFDPVALEQSAFGIIAGGTPTTYRLRFTARVAPFIRERVWHPTQKIKELRGGGVGLTFTCGESLEIEAWVASWRKGVVVIAPQALRERMRELGEWMTGAYGDGAQPGPQ